MAGAMQAVADRSKGDQQIDAQRPALVGLIGGIASGKSTVARLLQDRGALWIDSDRLAHQVLNSDEAIALLRARFGDDIVLANQQVDRSRLASFVFGDSSSARANKKWLEELIHPRVRAITEQRIAQAGSDYSFIVIDAPLLIEAGWAERCDRVLFVDAPQTLREQRAAERGWSTDELHKREAGQLPLAEKKQRATDIVSNSGSLPELATQVDRFVASLAK